MKNNKIRNFPMYFLFLVFSFVIFFSPVSSKAQAVSNQCEWKWKWVWVWENATVTRYNGGTGRYDTVTEQQYVYRYRYVYDCELVAVENNPTNSDSSPPNTTRNADGTLKPAKGYEWVNPDGENDFKVKLKEGLVETAPGNLRPSNGYRWVNPDNKDDFRVEPIDGNSTESTSLDLTGNWRGTYTCGQGLTNLSLEITQNNPSNITAIFSFYANKDNPSVPSGSYRMKGRYNAATNKVVLSATSWINQPDGYSTVDLEGIISSEGKKISGKVIEGSCSSFSVTKE